MLPKNRRLNLSKDFRRVASGTRQETAHLVVFSKSEDNPHPLIGIALSKKISLLSSQRNEIKRSLSLAIESLYSLLRPEVSLIFMPKPNSKLLEPKVFKEEIQSLKGVWRGN